ncbi:hypothetical protein NL676_014295 [Syzygium grande]|nr:hypothetical protein NL676_014295 [Syzygium grande]
MTDVSGTPKLSAPTGISSLTSLFSFKVVGDVTDPEIGTELGVEDKEEFERPVSELERQRRQRRRSRRRRGGGLDVSEGQRNELGRGRELQKRGVVNEDLK